ncbi:MAG: hypothetical protein WKF82_02705 [Nocardioidaceae bacterium]
MKVAATDFALFGPRHHADESTPVANAVKLGQVVALRDITHADDCDAYAIKIPPC